VTAVFGLHPRRHCYVHQRCFLEPENQSLIIFKNIPVKFTK
jgi:hypothetical protein